MHFIKNYTAGYEIFNLKDFENFSALVNNVDLLLRMLLSRTWWSARFICYFQLIFSISFNKCWTCYFQVILNFENKFFTYLSQAKRVQLIISKKYKTNQLVQFFWVTLLAFL